MRGVLDQMADDGGADEPGATGDHVLSAHSHIAANRTYDEVEKLRLSALRSDFVS